jgi:hypothetical protein
MSSREVTDWLKSHRLGAYVDVFAEHDVTWDDLGELGDEDLRKMGLKTRERRRLLQAIALISVWEAVSANNSRSCTTTSSSRSPCRISSVIQRHFLEIVRSIHAKFEVLLSRLGGTKYQNGR